MEQVLVGVGTRTGFPREDHTTEVVFEGEKIASTHHRDGDGSESEVLYRTSTGYKLHGVKISMWRKTPDRFSFEEISEREVIERFPELAQKAGLV